MRPEFAHVVSRYTGEPTSPFDSALDGRSCPWELWARDAPAFDADSHRVAYGTRRSSRFGTLTKCLTSKVTSTASFARQQPAMSALFRQVRDRTPAAIQISMQPRRRVI